MPKHSPAAIVAALREEGIDAAELTLGLAAYADDPRLYARALRRADPTLASPATVAPAARDRSCGGYANCCACPACQTRSRVGPVRAQPPARQPWEPRPSRR